MPQANGYTDASDASDASSDTEVVTPEDVDGLEDTGADAADADAAAHAAAHAALDSIAAAYIPTMLPSFAYAPRAEDLAVPAWVGALAPAPAQPSQAQRPQPAPPAPSAPPAPRRRIAPEHDPRRLGPRDPRERSPARTRLPPAAAPFPLRARSPPAPAPRAPSNGERRLPPPPLHAPAPVRDFPPRFLRRGRGVPRPAVPAATHALPLRPGPLTYAALDARLCAPAGNTFVRVHSPATRARLEWTGVLASSGFSCSRAYAGLSPASYGGSRAALGYGAGWVPGPYLAAEAARHVLAQPPEDGAVWISATASLLWAVWAVARALAAGEETVRTAVIAPTGEVVVPASRVPLPPVAGARAKEAAEVLFFARVFGGSVLADLVWTAEPCARRPLVGSWLDCLAFDPAEPFERALACLARGGDAWPEQPVHS